MKKNVFPLAIGITLVLIGITSLVGNVFLELESWKLWPTVVLLSGMGLTAPALFSFKERNLGAFFIPGLPVLTTGAILMFASLTDNWDVWAWAWSLIVIATGLGMGLAAFPLRASGLAIPAIIIGMNGLLLAFCAITGLWAVWALMWPIEPFAVGLGLLVVGFANRSSGAKQAGMILTGIAGGGFFLASFISMFNASILRFAVPGMLMLTGLVLVVGYLVRGKDQPILSESEPVPPTA